MDKNKKVPEVRFKGFELDWKETPLSEYMTPYPMRKMFQIHTTSTIFILFQENMAS